MVFQLSQKIDPLSSNLIHMNTISHHWINTNHHGFNKNNRMLLGSGLQWSNLAKPVQCGWWIFMGYCVRHADLWLCPVLVHHVLCGQRLAWRVRDSSAVVLLFTVSPVLCSLRIQPWGSLLLGCPVIFCRCIWQKLVVFVPWMLFIIHSHWPGWIHTLLLTV